MEFKDIIYIDSREPKKRQDQAISFFGKDNVEVITSKVGDYICSDVCIERKTITDFIGSHNNQRLNNQIENMKKNFENPFVIVVGPEWHVSKYSNWTKTQFNSRIAGMSMDYDIKILRADTDIGLLSQARSLFKRAGGREHKESMIAKIAPKYGNEYIGMVCTVSGVGPKKAEKILEKYEVYELWDVSIDDLLEIDGIGKSYAEKIKSVFTKVKK